MPFTAEHRVVGSHAWWGGLLHAPSDGEHCALPVHSVVDGVVQKPAAAHGMVVPLHAAAVRLHVPPRTAQTPGLQGSPSLLQCPIWAQAAVFMQL